MEGGLRAEYAAITEPLGLRFRFRVQGFARFGAKRPTGVFGGFVRKVSTTLVGRCALKEGAREFPKFAWTGLQKKPQTTGQPPGMCKDEAPETEPSSLHLQLSVTLHPGRGLFQTWDPFQSCCVKDKLQGEGIKGPHVGTQFYMHKHY